MPRAPRPAFRLARLNRRWLTPRLRRVRIVSPAAGLLFALTATALIAAVGVANATGGPANDDFADAYVLTGESVTRNGDSNADATAQPGEPNQGDGLHSIWYRWTAPRSGTVEVSVSAAGTCLGVYTGSAVDDLSRLDAGCFSDNVERVVNFQATDGVTYHVMVTDYPAFLGGYSGPLNISLSILTPPPPPNDDFADAYLLTGESVTRNGDSNADATGEPGEPSQGDGLHSIWYRWTAPRSAVVGVSVSAAGTCLGVYSGSAVNALSALSAGCFSDLEVPAVRFQAMGGLTYHVMVTDYPAFLGGYTGPLNISLGILSPLNDHFADAQALSGVPTSAAGTNQEATTEPGEPPGHGANSIWYAWTVPQSGVFEVTVASSDPNVCGALIGVYTGTAVDALTEVALGGATVDCHASEAVFSANAGTTVGIAVGGFQGVDTPWATFDLSIALLTPPPNDDLALAIGLSGTAISRTTETNLHATKEVDEPDHAGNPGGASVWYSWTPTHAGVVAIDAYGSSFNPVLGVYTGSSYGSLQEVPFDPDLGETDVDGRLLFQPEAGTTYRIAVDGRAGSDGIPPRGDVALAINQAGPPPSVSVADVTRAETNSGTVTVTLTAMLTDGYPFPMTFDWATADDNATSPSDFPAATGTVTFPASTIFRTFTVTINGDTFPEANEDLLVNLSNPSVLVIGDPQAKVTITNDDGAPPSISIANAGTTEGDSGAKNVTLALTLSPAAAQTVNVSWATANATATAPADYKTASGVVTFAPGVTSRTIIVEVVGDVLPEFDETFRVNLSQGQNAAIGDAQSVITIVNNDTAQIRVGDIQITEGNSGTANASFPITINGAASSPVTVAWAAANGTATSPADYTAASGTVTFSPGQTTRNALVQVKGELATELNETFVLNLTSPTGGVIADAQGVATILNDDAPTLRIADVSRAEGSSGTGNAVFAVSLSGPVSQVVTVQWASADATATAPSDYVAASGSITFSPGEITKNALVQVKGDLLTETNETFTVNLSGAAGASIFDAVAVGTITNDDNPTLRVTDATLTEGNSGTANALFAVTLSGPVSQVVSVSWGSADGTAAQPADYNPASGSITFSPGETSKNALVQVKGDAVSELNETFSVNLSGASGATIADGTGVGTITNDDTPQIRIADVTVTEGATGTVSAVFTITLTGPKPQAVTVNWATADGTAVQPEDYLSGSGTVTFSPGETSKAVVVQVKGDTAVEPNQTFVVNLSGASGGTITDAQGVGTITNDD